ncbi:MAG TPA: ROK family protein [Polyangiaceae bacterium]|jgi:glucokinase|nr:ROK family protein [Polyangiaceae bacterium]
MLIGVDFSNAVIKAGIVEDGRVLRSIVADTPNGAEPPEILDTIARVVGALSSKPDAVGIAIPGEVNTDGRCWRLPNTRGFEGVRIAQEVSRRIRCPIAVENRATTAALAEQLYGHGRRHQTFLLVSLETGIGGGLVIGHQLYPGSNGFGAEIGHICVDSSLDAPLCACGQRGCVEAFAGTRAVLRKFHELGGKASELSTVATSARRAEWIGVLSFETMGRALGRALATVQNFLDLGALVFAGSTAQHFDLIEPFVREELRLKSFAPPLAEVPLLVSELGENAGVIGAAHLTTL